MDWLIFIETFGKWVVCPVAVAWVLVTMVKNC
ncbi:hypothetical protein [Achromobacter phage Motura]|uniref:Uncharacterized protein n=1 Tax=Achromobacter phage Motura TaxID=2591403 RepID=A0A514CSY9_9CAUD|nr:hypothetical protein H1O15_gp204 [Achromobacter phage Motura]QDH83584.1 hypothetical protein [Achromobacter phage Motura]